MSFVCCPAHILDHSLQTYLCFTGFALCVGFRSTRIRMLAAMLCILFVRMPAKCNNDFQHGLTVVAKFVRWQQTPHPMSGTERVVVGVYVPHCRRHVCSSSLAQLPASMGDGPWAAAAARVEHEDGEDDGAGWATAADPKP